MTDISELFGCKTFSDSVMRTRLPIKIYQSLKETSHLGKSLDPDIADVVATAMKDWAISQGATHYTHWFQPLNNVFAGKHDSFLAFSDPGKGIVVSEFSASALVKGEPDASSFPSGGLRATFEARGYTAWDPSSPVFVKENTLYIPTAFCSYTGEALDTKTPLLRSMQALNKEAMRLLKSIGITSSKVVWPTVGAEQEYFLVDRTMYERRLDLKLCGRTLIGAKPPKGQELEDHYFGRIRLRVGDFMRDLDHQLWSLGIPSKTKHNETAPAQHELAPIFENVNIACDNNALTMETLRITAKRHNMACLLHEKPFEYINGSGKHNNFSLCTDDGINFLNPGKHPEENKLFLLSLCALISSVDSYSDLIRLSAACCGNDNRLGGFEAPPAIISVFLGEKLTSILTSIASGTRPSAVADQNINMDVNILPSLKRDDADRNRTSPFAFTGNKFEFRMLGSSQSIALINTVLCAAIADTFSSFADRLEIADDIEVEIARIIADVMHDHQKIIFNGNNYTAEWVEEAKRRGLPILKKSIDAIDSMITQKNLDLFARQNVFTEAECHSRHEISLDNFVNVVSIEAQTLIHIIKRQIFPHVVDYAGKLAGDIGTMETVGIRNKAIKSHLIEISDLVEGLKTACDDLVTACLKSFAAADLRAHAQYVEDTIRPRMETLRTVCDKLETMLPDDQWPMPTYTDLLYRI